MNYKVYSNCFRTMPLLKYLMMYWQKIDFNKKYFMVCLNCWRSRGRLISRFARYSFIWMRIYIAHISHIVSRRFTILIEWDRTSACQGASGCRYRFIFDLTHPPNPCMKCTMKLQIDLHTGNYVPYSFRQVCGFFNVPCWPCNTEAAGDGAYGLQSLSEKTWMSNHLLI